MPTLSAPPRVTNDVTQGRQSYWFLIQLSRADAHNTHNVAVGFASRRASAIGSPQSMQLPKSSRCSRTRAASMRRSSCCERACPAFAMDCSCIASIRDNRPTRDWSSSTTSLLLRRESSRDKIAARVASKRSWNRFNLSDDNSVRCSGPLIPKGCRHGEY